MTTPTKTPTVDRDTAFALALSEAICPPHMTPADALIGLLHNIGGAAGYLNSSATLRKFEIDPLPEHLAGLGGLIADAVKIAIVLADEMHARSNAEDRT